MPRPKLIVQHDTSKPYTSTLIDANGLPFPLDPTWPIRFTMAPALDDQAGPRFINTATFVSAAGKVSYTWRAQDVAIVGPFKAQWKVTTPLGVQTFPEDDFLDIIIIKDVAP